MFPIDFHLGELYIRSHVIFDFLSFFIGYHYYVYLKNKKGDFLTEDIRWSLIVGAAVGALIGSRFLGALENLYLFFHPPSLLYFYASKTIVGGIIGAIIGVEITKKIIGEKRPTGDLFAFPLILGIVTGRIGCFLTGVIDGTVGLPSSLPWAFDQGDGIPRHPTSLYEIAFLLILGIVLWQVHKKQQLKNGTIFKLVVILYFTFRFLIEFIKPREIVFLSLSSIQVAAVIFSLWYIYALLKDRRKNSVV